MSAPYSAGHAGEGGFLSPAPRLAEPHRHSLTNVLIIGGTTAEREQVAHTFHAESPLRTGPFVAVDCQADREPLRMALRAWTLPGSGSHTNPLRAAETGTLYLDMVEAVPPDAQPLLLVMARRLQGGPVDETGWPCAGRLVVGNPRALSVVVSEGHFDPALNDALDKVRVDLGPAASQAGRG